MQQLQRVNLMISEINTVFHEASLRLGLTDSASMILYTIQVHGQEGCCPLGQILELTGLRKQTVNSALRKLEEDGILYLQTAEGRRKTVCLTETGKQFSARTAGLLAEKENEIYDSWTEEERRTYLELTRRYLDQIREKFKELGK